MTGPLEQAFTPDGEPVVEGRKDPNGLATWGPTPPAMVIRPYQPGLDQALILDSWGHQIRPCPPFRGMTAAEFAGHRELIRRLIDRHPPVVACHGDHPHQVYGWACGEPARRILHMIYTRSTWRVLRVATTLLAHLYETIGSEPLYLTHETPSTRYYRKRWQLKHNPYLVVSE